MNSTVKIAASLAVIGCCALWLWYYFGSQPAPGETVAHLQPLACAACDKAYGALAGDFPVKCRFCGEKQVWGAFKCGDCNAIVPIKRNKGALADGQALRCSKCKGVGLYQVPGDEIEVFP